jgi:hypothetical protein
MANSAEETDTPNALDMSDEEFMKMDPSSFEGGSVDDADQAGTDDETPPPDNNSADDDEKADPAEEALADDKQGKADESTEAGDKQETPVVENKEVPKSGTSELTDAQYIEMGKQLMSEFKANGTTIKVKSVDDAIQLMQMGANYHKKMTGLKPSMKVLKLLENHGLMDESKLNYLIDLSQKKPGAITQLLKDSKIDPLSIDMDATKEYVPQQRSISDTEILLDEVLDSISTSPSYNKTLTVIGDEWDAGSKTLIAQNPVVIKTINAHMENGIYDQVKRAVDYERSLGKLQGVNDFEAYQTVGSYMHENNLFVSAAGKTTAVTNQATPPVIAAKASTTAADKEAERAQRKAAASSSRASASSDTSKGNYNPLNMSDEEFIKLNKLSL